MAFRAPVYVAESETQRELLPRIGSDLVTVSDVARSIDVFGDRYLRRVFTPLELAQSRSVPERLAGRFAGKEAVTKVLRPARTTPVAFHDIEIVSGPSGAPVVRLRGRARSEAADQGIGRIAVSFSHDNGFAFATAVTLLQRKESAPMKNTIRTVLDLHGHLSTPTADLSDSDDLYRAGLTSHATVNVMLALEDELDLEFPDELLTRETFSSIDALEAAAKSLQNA